MFKEYYECISRANLQYLSDRLKDDEDVVEAALKYYYAKSYSTGIHMSDRLKNNKKFILDMISKHRLHNIKEITETFQNDKEVVFNLAMSGNLHFEEIPKKFETNKNIILGICGNNIPELSKLSKEIQDDLEFVHKMFKQYNYTQIYRMWISDGLKGVRPTIKKWIKIETENEYLNQAMDDYVKIEGFFIITELVVKTCLPPGISVNIDDFL